VDNVSAVHIVACAMSPGRTGGHRGDMSAPHVEPAAGVAAGLAAGLSMQPDTLRSIANRALALSAALRWHSAAQPAFAAQVASTVLDLRASADRLDEVVNIIRCYASASGS
jgi:hypothetical protein